MFETLVYYMDEEMDGWVDRWMDIGWMDIYTSIE